MTNIIISIYQYRDTPGSRLDAAIAAGKLHIGSDGLPRHRDGTRAAWFGPRVGWVLTGQMWTLSRADAWGLGNDLAAYSWTACRVALQEVNARLGWLTPGLRYS
jgi:hypothetical protein